nr:immunoglobulin heavy chain junction region [Mus musculus]MBK4197197.1 immunoglobulin heavy chain junction region [Mus musculus]
CARELGYRSYYAMDYW